MKTKLLFLFAIILSVGAHCPDFIGMPVQAQELPDTVWTKKIDNVHVIKFSPDGQYIFVQNDGIGQGYVYKIETFTAVVVDIFNLNRPLMKSLSISPTGDTLIVSGNGLIMLWNVNTGDTIYTLKYGKEACFTPDGRRIITTTGKMGLNEPQILVIDIATKQIIKSFKGRYYYAGNLQISSDGKYFSFNDFRGTYTTVILVDLNTSAELKIFERPGGSYTNLGFTPDNRYLGTASSEGIHLWDLNTLNIYKTNKYYETTNVSDLGISNLKYSYDSKFFIYAYWDQEDYDPNKIIVWNTEGDSLEYEYPYSAQNALDISKDNYIAAWGQYPGYLTYLRPKWNETSINDIIENDFKYSYSNGKLKIFFEEEVIAKPEINIYNILGVGARHAVPVQQGNEIEMDLEYLTSGVYFVVVDFAGKRSVLKILKD